LVTPFSAEAICPLSLGKFNDRVDPISSPASLTVKYVPVSLQRPPPWRSINWGKKWYTTAQNGNRRNAANSEKPDGVHVCANQLFVDANRRTARSPPPPPSPSAAPAPVAGAAAFARLRPPLVPRASAGGAIGRGSARRSKIEYAVSSFRFRSAESGPSWPTEKSRSCTSLSSIRWNRLFLSLSSSHRPRSCHLSGKGTRSYTQSTGEPQLPRTTSDEKRAVDGKHNSITVSTAPSSGTFSCEPNHPLYSEVFAPEKGEYITRYC
jgi:hypothetical protein